MIARQITCRTHTFGKKIRTSQRTQAIGSRRSSNCLIVETACSQKIYENLGKLCLREENGCPIWKVAHRKGNRNLRMEIYALQKMRNERKTADLH